MGLQEWIKRSFFRNSYNGNNPFVNAVNPNVKAPNVTVQSSLTLSPIYTAIKIKAETIASLRFSVYERKPNNDIVEAFDHPIWELLNYEPNEKYNPFTLKETLESSIDLHGNGFIEVKRGPLGVTGLVFHPVQYVEMLLPHGSGKIYYRVSEPGYETRILDFDDMIHVPSMAVMDGLFGISPILQNRTSLALAQSARDYGVAFFGGGASVSGILTAPGLLSPEVKKNIQDEWETKYSGLANVGRTALLWGGLSYTPISINPIDSGLLETLKYGVEEASRIYRIPLHKMSNLDRSTNNNIEHQGIEFVTDCILPSCRRIEFEFNRKLFLDPINRKRYFVRFDIDSIMRGDSASRSEYLRSMFNIGALSQNEIRINHLNMNGIGPEGDKYYVQLNMGQPVNDKNKQEDDRK